MMPLSLLGSMLLNEKMSGLLDGEDVASINASRAEKAQSLSSIRPPKINSLSSPPS